MTSAPAVSWREAAGSDLFDVIRGVTYRAEESSREQLPEHIPVLRAGNIQDNTIVLDDLVWVPKRVVKDTQLLRDGDILIATSSGSSDIVGKAATATDSVLATPFAFGAFCATIRPKPGVNPSWLSLFFQTGRYRRWVRGQISGININNLRASSLQSLPVPIPSSDEQDRIIKLVQGSLMKTAEMKVDLERSAALAGRLFGAVRDSLFAGTDDDLRSRVQWENWIYKPFFEVLDFRGGSQPPKATFIDQPRKGYVRLLQIRDFASDDKAVYIKDDARWQKCNDSDILVGRYGASVGKVLRGKSGAYNVALTKILYSPHTFDPEFLFFWLQSRDFQDPLKTISRSAQNGFNKDDLRDIQVPVPTLTVQRALGHWLVRTLKHVTSLEKDASLAQRLADRLRGALLDRAFEESSSVGDPA